VQPLGRGPHRRSLRKLLQETSVPPWERERIPLIFIDGRFAAMPRIVVDEFCSTGTSEAGIEILLDDLREKSWK
jgi:tRNA(Ile)-lysidine synthase